MCKTSSQFVAVVVVTATVIVGVVVHSINTSIPYKVVKFEGLAYQPLLSSKLSRSQLAEISCYSTAGGIGDCGLRSLGEDGRDDVEQHGAEDKDEDGHPEEPEHLVAAAGLEARGVGALQVLLLLASDGLLAADVEELRDLA